MGYNKGISDGRIGYYTKEQLDQNYVYGYNAGQNSIPIKTITITTKAGSGDTSMLVEDLIYKIQISPDGTYSLLSWPSKGHIVVRNESSVYTNYLIGDTLVTVE